MKAPASAGFVATSVLKCPAEMRFSSNVARAGSARHLENEEEVAAKARHLLLVVIQLGHPGIGIQPELVH